MTNYPAQPPYPTTDPEFSNSPEHPVHPSDSAQNFYRVLRRPGVKAFLILVAVALIIGAILRILTPPPTTIPQTNFVTTNRDGSNSIFSNIVYEGPDATFPNQLPIASAIASSTTARDIERLLIEKFELTPAREPQNLWVGIDFYLTYDRRQDRYLLHNQFANSRMETETQPVNKAQAIAAAQEFLQDIFPDTELAPLESEIAYYSSDHEHYEEVSENSAQQLNIPFAYLIGGYPLLYGKQSAFPFEVTVNNRNQVVQVSFAPQFLTIVPVEVVDLISVSEALRNINDRNLGSLVKAQSREVDELNLSSVNSGLLNRVSLEYRLDPDLKLAFPFYRFDGTITNRDDALLDASIITPAVVMTTQ